MLTLKIEFKTTEMRKQTTKTGKELYWQKAGLLTSGDWPIVFDVFCPDGLPHPLGKADFEVTFRSDQWGSLEIAAFNCRVLESK